jgi:hypothetical protein
VRHGPYQLKRPNDHGGRGKRTGLRAGFCQTRLRQTRRPQARAIAAFPRQSADGCRRSHPDHQAPTGVVLLRKQLPPPAKLDLPRDNIWFWFMPVKLMILD